MLALSRQNCAALKHKHEQISGISKGGYVYQKDSNHPELTIVSSGSEMTLAIEVADKLRANHTVNIVSVPCLDLFFEQDAVYRDSVIKRDSNIICIEAASRQSWCSIAGDNGLIISIDDFGYSAPAKDVLDHFGFSVPKILKSIVEKFKLKEEIYS